MLLLTFRNGLIFWQLRQNDSKADGDPIKSNEMMRAKAGKVRRPLSLSRLLVEGQKAAMRVAPLLFTASVCVCWYRPPSAKPLEPRPSVWCPAAFVFPSCSTSDWL